MTFRKFSSFFFYVESRDLSFQFPPVKLSSGVFWLVYKKVVLKMIATTVMAYLHDRTQVLTGKSKQI